MKKNILLAVAALSFAGAAYAAEPTAPVTPKEEVKPAVEQSAKPAAPAKMNHKKHGKKADKAG